MEISLFGVTNSPSLGSQCIVFFYCEFHAVDFSRGNGFFYIKKILYIVRERGSKLWNLPHLPTSTLSIELMTYFTIY